MTREEQMAKYREYRDRVLEGEHLTEGEIEEYHSLEDELLGNKRDMVSETEADARSVVEGIVAGTEGNKGMDGFFATDHYSEPARSTFTPTVKTMDGAIPVSRFNDPSELTERQFSGVYGGPNNPGYAAEYNRGDNIFRGNSGEFLSTPESQAAINVDEARIRR